LFVSLYFSLLPQFFRLKDNFSSTTQRSRKPSKIVEEVLEQASSAETVAHEGGTECLRKNIATVGVSNVVKEEGVTKEETMMIETSALGEGGTAREGCAKGVNTEVVADEENVSKSCRSRVEEGLVGQCDDMNQRKRKRAEETKEGGDQVTGETKKIKQTAESQLELDHEVRRKRGREDTEDKPDVPCEGSAPDLPSTPPMKRTKLGTASEGEKSNTSLLFL
jgi:hypothetical protein